MASIQFFIRTDHPARLKEFLDSALNLNIELESIADIRSWEWADVDESISAAAGEYWRGWHEWYSYANTLSFGHCLYLAVLESCSSLYSDIREKNSTYVDAVWMPGAGVSFDRRAFIAHLEKYRSSTEWRDEEGNVRLPYPQEVVDAGIEQPEYVNKFKVVS